MNQAISSLESTNKRDMNFAMRISLAVGILLFLVKGLAYFLTDSAAVFSDAAESLIHVFVVLFAVYSMWLSFKPADSNHPYGHEKITFFSAGFEGALIMFAAFYIFYEAFHRIDVGHEQMNFGWGSFLITFAIVTNLVLSLYLIREGKKHKSLVLEANGKHILTDCWTSIGALLALFLVRLTGHSFYDPVIAMINATGILVTGFLLVKKSIGGLMDQIDLPLHQQVQTILRHETEKRGLSFHHLRERSLGQKALIEFHLLFPSDISLLKAHELASQIEASLRESLDTPSEILTHLEPEEDHDLIHKKYGLPV